LAAPVGQVEGASQSPAPLPRVDAVAFVLAVLAAGFASVIIYVMQASRGMALHEVMNTALWGTVVGMTAYVLYGLGWLPGATYLQHIARPWGAAVVALVAGLAPLAVVRGRAFVVRLGASQLQE
jgi:phosphatidylglycerophosphate synthase